MLRLRDAVRVHALAHVTGGGIEENLPRVLPAGLGAEIRRSSWVPNPVFRWIAKSAPLDATEAYHVLNMGCGMIVALASADAPTALDLLAREGEAAWVAGRVVAGEGVRFVD